MAKDKTKKKKEHSNAPSEKNSIASRIRPVSEVKYGMTAIFYGRSGTGKTTLLASFPKPMLLIDIKDKGTDSVVNVEGVETILCETWEDIEDVFWFLESKEGKKYKSVGIDTISQMQGLAVSEVKRQAGRSEDSPMSQQLWGNVSALMQQWLLSFRDLEDFNVCFLAQDRSKEVEEDLDDDQITPSVGPQLMPSVAKTINAAVNVIGYTFIASKVKTEGGKINRRTEYHLRIGPHPVYITKVRSPKDSFVPDTLKDPTYKKILSVIEGTYEAPTKKEKDGKKKKKAS